MAQEELRRLDALLTTGLGLARKARSGRLLLARIADSIDVNWIPRPWGDEIVTELEAALVGTAEPLSDRDLHRILRDAWGSRPEDELDDLDPDPVAVTPGAQVHRGSVDGKPVAVKVLRPGLAASVRQDLALVELLAGPLGSAFPGVNPAAATNEFRERVLEELDLEHEAEVQRRFHRALRGHPFLNVPAPVTRLCHESVLVSEWADGVSLWDAPDPDLAAARLIAFGIGTAVTVGFSHADLHPDNVLVGLDGGLTILDFGATRRVDRERAAAAIGVLDALAAVDGEALGGAMAALGWLPAPHGPVAIELARHALGDLGVPGRTRLDHAAVIAARDRALQRPDLIGNLLVAGSPPAEDLWPARGFAVMLATIGRIGARGDWLALLRTALNEGWDAKAKT
ncbi:MAG TPA: AarF/ABC1/UbiB kinase family protein [Solirubrobacteraceae bacterium]|nr:AarF/ABC1/UbiB kinase family protein [Solirubrobacteraceae bacterium]